MNARFAPIYGSTDLRFEVQLKYFIVQKPQAGPLTLILRLAGQDFYGANSRCTAYRTKLFCGLR